MVEAAEDVDAAEALVAIEIVAAIDATLTVDAVEVAGAQNCFEYFGSYDGGCKAGGQRLKAWSQTSGWNWYSYLHSNPGNFGINAEGLASAKTWCSAEPKCIGFGAHYSYDRYYIGQSTSIKESALDCSNKAANKCGDGTPTNDCYVKFRCGEATPYAVGSATGILCQCVHGCHSDLNNIPQTKNISFI